jgi:hypothetical protein
LIRTIDRLAVEQVAGTRIEAGHVARVAAAGRDDLAPVQEGIRHIDRLVEQAAGIEPQIQDIALDLGVAGILPDLFDRSLQIVGGALGEGVDLDVADVVFQAEAHGPHLDDVAHDGQLDRLFGAFADDRQFDRAC